MEKWLSENWLRVLAIALVLGAAQTSFSLPYAYFQLMNWVVVVAAAVTAWEARQQKNNLLLWLFILLAVLFNPVAPIYLESEIWKWADIVAALIFGASFFALPQTKKENPVS